MAGKAAGSGLTGSRTRQQYRSHGSRSVETGQMRSEHGEADGGETIRVNPFGREARLPHRGTEPHGDPGRGAGRQWRGDCLRPQGRPQGL